MAKVLFGVSGDGIGHGTRSKATIDHLIEKGHDVRIVSSRKGYEFLSSYFNVSRILGFRVVNQTGEVSIRETASEFTINLLKYGSPTVKWLLSEVDSFKPDLIISDFEPFVSIVSRLKGIPLISIDNQHVITWGNLEYPRDWRNDFLIANAVCKSISGFAKHFFVTSFFTPELKKRAQGKVTLVGPILRKEISQQVSEIGDHIIVYTRIPQRARKVSSLIEKLEANRFLVYGSNNIESTARNITFKKQSAEEFLKDLASSKAVLTNGGHSLISESLYLGKPVYSIPTKGDFEQMINGYYVERLGYGLCDLEPSIGRVQTFLENLKYFEKNIVRDRNNFNGNKLFYQVLDSKVTSTYGRS